MKKLRTILVRLGKVLVIWILASAVIHGVLSLVWGHRFEAEVDKLRARGEPVAMVDLAGEPVPDSENAAIAFQPIFTRLKDRKTAHDHVVLTKVVADDRALRPLVRIDAKDRAPDPNYWPAAVKVAPEFDWLAPRVAAALSRPVCQFHVDWWKGYDAELPHYAQLRQVCSALAARSLIYSRQGRTDEAFRWAKLSLKTAESIRNDPLLIGLLVRLAMDTTSTEAVMGALRYGHLTPAQAKEMFDAYAGLEFTGQFAEAMKGERAAMIHFMGQTQSNGPLWAVRYIQNWRSGRKSPVLGFVCRPWTYLEGTIAIHCMDAAMANARIPYRQIRPEDDEMRRIPSYAFLNRTLMPAFGRVRMQIAQKTSVIGLMQVALALSAYHDQHRAYPPTLDALQAALGWPLPDDPLSGKSFRYSPEGKGYMLYSVGLNMRDDHGRNDITSDQLYDLIKSKADDIVVTMDR